MLLTGDGLRSKTIFRLLIGGTSPSALARDSACCSKLLLTGTTGGTRGEDSKADIAYIA